MIVNFPAWVAVVSTWLAWGVLVTAAVAFIGVVWVIVWGAAKPRGWSFWVMAVVAYAWLRKTGPRSRTYRYHLRRLAIEIRRQNAQTRYENCNETLSPDPNCERCKGEGIEPKPEWWSDTGEVKMGKCDCTSRHSEEPTDDN